MQISKLFISIAISLTIIIGLSGCDKKTVFNQNKDFADAQWLINNECAFEVEILDTNMAYNLYYNVRNNLTYPYYNLYVTRYLLDDKGKIINEKLDEIFIADEKTGKPTGSGLGDIYDHKVAFAKNYKFPKAGKYTIKVKQFMRQNPLPDVLSFGIAIEKAN